VSTLTVEPTEAAPLALPEAAGKSVEETFDRLDSSDAGLPEAEATARLARFGPNT
jgi:hypothetical protein